LALHGSFKINDSKGEYAIYYDAVYKKKENRSMSEKHPECPLYNPLNCKEYYNPKLCAFVKKDKVCLKKKKPKTKQKAKV